MVLRNALEGLAVSSGQDTTTTRLVEILTSIEDLEASGAKDSQQTTTTTRLEEIKGVLDSLEAGGAKNAQLVQIRDFVDTVEDLLLTLTAVDFATQTTLGAVLVKLNDIFMAVDGLEVTAGNIEFSADAVNLQTDEVEDLLRQLRDRLGNTGDAANPAGTLTAQLRALHIALTGVLSVVGPLTDAELRANPVPVVGPLTDAQIRANPVEVSVPGNVTLDESDAEPERILKFGMRPGFRYRRVKESNGDAYHARYPVGATDDQPVFDVIQIKKITGGFDSGYRPQIRWDQRTLGW